MYKILLILLALAVVGGIFLTQKFEASQIYEKEIVEKLIETKPDWVGEEEDPDAVAAYQAVIKKKELEAELDVLNLEIHERQERVTEIEKELGTY